MIEVFKTNVATWHAADILLSEIRKRFPLYEATFDLDDCDRILRIKCAAREVHAVHLIDLLKDSGYHAEILEDILPDGVPSSGSTFQRAFDRC
ncbi:MAG TPA: hypothetical protein VGK59_07215 [Ohtaekwangia sp.]